MTLMKRYIPAFPSLSNLMDDIFSTDLDMMENVNTVPAVNIKERDKDYVIELAAPGLKKDDFDIDLDNNVLTISSVKEDEQVEEKAEYTKREFRYSEFRRSFTLPETADTEKIDAEYKDGILYITIAKKPEAQTKPKRKINIK